MLLSHQDLKTYQLRAAQWVLEHPGAALWLEMGLGKTVSTLTAMQELIEGLECHKGLVVAPKRVVNRVWPKELDGRWSHLQGLSFTVLRGTPSEREAKLAQPTDIHIINYELLLWLVKQLKRWPYDLLVLDESTKIKNNSGKRFKALRKARGATRRIVELTGTPSPNGLHDLWAQVYLLDGGIRLGRTVTAFRDRWFDRIPMGDYVKWQPKPNAQDEIQQRCSDICLSMRAKDYLELPDLITNTVEVELPAQVYDRYREFEREMFIELSKETEIEAMNAAALTTKCLQIANGAVYTDDEGNWQGMHTAKLDALQEIVEEAGSPVIAVYQYKHDLIRLQQRFPEGRALEDSEALEDAWNAGKIPLLFVHPDSAGHGLNLQFGGNVIAFFGLTWNLESYQQVIERIGPTRQAQSGLDRPVFLHHIVAAGTVDEQVLERVRTKRGVQDLLMQATRLRPTH